MKTGKAPDAVTRRVLRELRAAVARIKAATPLKTK